VGSAVGADVGRADGAGVLLPGTYVGSTEGSTLGAEEGRAEGAGVLLPGT